MATEVKKSIFQEVAATKFYTVIVDECKDVCNFEKLSFCVRYSIGSKPIERFVQIVHLSEGSYGAKAIVKEVEKLVTELIGFGCMLTGLGADGASVISGEWTGVQALLKQIFPWLIYVHCVTHRLNLVVVASLKGTCKTILTLVDKLHSLFSSAKTNYVFMKVQPETKVNVMAMANDVATNPGPRSSIECLYLNSRSLNAFVEMDDKPSEVCKIDVFQQLVYSSDYVVCVSETWLNNSVLDSELLCLRVKERSVNQTRRLLYRYLFGQLVKN
ncbi:Hypothetical predicted protein [Paramuricea clavata]|uniref:Uncharacterized protein n=1 Tax=Paramuricea clavata TaxID=317549 RepID=A0A7D9ED82_PARCT|nr:Hypothetical predicted protein [Paramuricea clavata]